MRKRDARFLALCAATLLLAGLVVRESHLVVEMIEGGYRKIDTELVRRFIQGGELSAREALYYREARQAPDGER